MYCTCPQTLLYKFLQCIDKGEHSIYDYTQEKKAHFLIMRICQKNVMFTADIMLYYTSRKYDI